MVFFTCNHCGESLKKPAVEKHYQWKGCRGAPPFLTCVDCLKDFRDGEYQAHTKCVTELERYSAKGFVAKPDKNKGAQKQEAWTEALQGLQTRADLDKDTKEILQRIADQSNVPRKQAKFLNFIKSSMRMSPQNAIRLWDIIQSAQDEFQKNVAAKREEAAIASGKKRPQNEMNDTKEDETNENNENLEIETNDEQIPDGQPKTKKIKSNAEPSSAGQVENGQDNGTTTVAMETKKDDIVLNGLSQIKVPKNKKPKAECKSAAATAEATTNISKDKFQWSAVILEIVQKKQSIELTKLKAKVYKQFLSQCPNRVGTPQEKWHKKFAKHFNRMTQVKIVGSAVNYVE